MSELVPDTSKTAIAARIVAVRKARSLTSGALAAALKVSPQRWNHYEQGRSVPPPDILSRFWQVTGATSDFVLFGRMDGLPRELYLALTETPETQKTA